jgi:hypothetical protein
MLHTTPKVVYTFLTGRSVKWEHRSEKCKLEYEGCPFFLTINSEGFLCNREKSEETDIL